MKLFTLNRIVLDHFWKPEIRAVFWDAAKLAGEARTLLFQGNHSLRKLVISDYGRYLFGNGSPVSAGPSERARAAVDWLLRAQSATPDDGVSLGYFPCDGAYEGWRPSYPETTGYIMTSLFQYARRFDVPDIKEAAVRMGHWEIAVQMPFGAVQGGPLVPPERQTPAAFNTGMVLDGWCTAYEETRGAAFLDAARKAADFLVNDLDDEGYFRTNGKYVSAGEIKTYTCLCAWAMYRFGILAEASIYRDAAIRSVEAAIRQQRGNGWFAHNCLDRSDAPLTHTIGYALQGILEVGLLSGRADFIDAVRRGIDPILQKMAPSGYLPGRFYSDWEPAALSSCLTGSAQIAIVSYRLAEHTGLPGYKESADILVDFLKHLQMLDSENPALNGALAGSFPILGEYMRGGYPNWAAKYFLDALMMQCSASRHR